MNYVRRDVLLYNKIDCALHGSHKIEITEFIYRYVVIFTKLIVLMFKQKKYQIYLQYLTSFLDRLSAQS